MNDHDKRVLEGRINEVFGPPEPGTSSFAWMTPRDLALLEKIVLYLCPPSTLSDVLEWGAGRSTVYFAHKLSDRPTFWSAIEHNAEWAAKVRSLLPSSWPIPPARVVDCELGPTYTGDSIKGRYDLAIVDGRLRRRCLLAAADKADVVVLHDAERTYYHSAFAAYRHHQRIGNQLWFGTQSETTFSRLLRELDDDA